MTKSKAELEPQFHTSTFPTLCACVGRRSRDPSAQEMGQNGSTKDALNAAAIEYPAGDELASAESGRV
ncbi:hypothetical protein TNIN_26031 [Trichonephila inaurata madagascariensis]|uniref:Uncharacterized protein n=1 Tax=Trichonephila inaurata madagascariensis TaxID=2747483 RepID=A0A8X6JQW1_9ARAC|nr:hypothetical protein TNIN_26031 [Trichonephila inaurata madagascariensis]